MKLVKIILFLMVIIGIGVYFLAHSPGFLKKFPEEKISFSHLISQPAPSFPPAQSSPVFSPSSTPSSAPLFYGYSIPSGFISKQLSPYFKKVEISSAEPFSWSDYPSQIRLAANLTEGESIDITGWRLKTNEQEIIIPQAVKVYDPSGFAPQEDIILFPGNFVNIYSNRSPISRNLRLNKCTGYLQNLYDFNPALPQDCPSISRSEINYLSGNCQSYILSLWGCKLPEASFYNIIDNACREFLDTINQSACFQKHRFDPDFLSNEWRVWTGENILDPQHDRLRLFDKKGLLVDEYIY